MAALDDFQTRHSTITGRITETYKVGNKMLDYLEKQIILDFHLRGEQDEFEVEYPHLKKKALELLGYEFYYQLANHVGSPLREEEHPELYAKVVEI